MKLLRFLFFLVLLNISNVCYSQKLHALLFVNVAEPEREVDRTASMTEMYKFWGKIAEKIGYEYAPVKCTPSSFTAANAEARISGLSVGENDIVVFYYGGHGHNDGKNMWPSLNFLDRNCRQTDIMKKLKGVSSKAKLIICMADCCNKQSGMPYERTAAYDAFDNTGSIVKLFTGFTGKKSIMISSSKQGQYSWSDLKYGSFHGICFREVINGLYSENPTWDVVLEDVKKLTFKRTKEKQTPQFVITQAIDPFEN